MAAKNLVIVESPAKAKTIAKFLGKDYTVLASFGHVRDLPKSDMGVDVENGFKPKYQTSKDKSHGNAVKAIKAAYKKGETEIYIATDEDREGEAIGWHLLHILKIKEKEIATTKRIVFHEITKGAIIKAIENPRTIDLNLVNAQQARRILDRLVGYELSPLLWKKIRYGLSAGRVQSVAVRLIVEKEEEINAFDTKEYWSIVTGLETIRKDAFTAKVMKKNGKNFEMGNEAEATEVLDVVKSSDLKIDKLVTKDTKRNPAPPFITSTLQQEAARKLGFDVRRTMQVAQKLYEGMDVGQGTEGLITYMRTDSVNLSSIALQQAKETITKTYGKEYALDKPRFYKGKKGAQEAHEAIRPVNLTYKPQDIKRFLTDEQFKLYTLIWKRTLACQMAQAKLKNTSCDIAADIYTLRATGQQIVFPGFMKLYIEGNDEEGDAVQSKNDETLLPELNENEDVALKTITPKQHFTKPPARFTEASLVKKMEELGIGRPSTYAPTISTIQTRGYIEKNQRQLSPTDIAFVVTKLLKEHFMNVMDYPFTADMEDKLDKISEGEIDWVKMLSDFYTPFHATIEEKEKTIQKADIIARMIGTDPETKLPVQALMGRFGPYVKIGEVETPIKEAKTASIPEGMSFETITLEQALEVIKESESQAENNVLGDHPELGHPILALTGRFGPYIKLDDPDAKKPKMVSIVPPFDIETITLADALQLLTLPRQLGEEDGVQIQANNGRYGPYVQKAKEYRSIPNDGTLFTITLEAASKLLKEPKPKRGKGGKAATPGKVLGQNKKGKDISLKSGRYGAYVTDGKTNASLPKGDDEEKITLEDAIKLIAAKKKK